MRTRKNPRAEASPDRRPRRPLREVTDDEDDAPIARKPRSRAGLALGGLALALGVVALLTTRSEERRPPAPAIREAATASKPARTPVEAAEWRAKQHARIEAARREGDAARARGDFKLAESRFEEGFRLAQEVLGETDEDGDAELDAAVILIELADLGRQRDDEEEMTRRRRGADILLKLAQAFGAKDKALLDVTIARAIAMGGPAP